MTTGQKIRFIRHSRGITQEDLAQATGITQTLVSKIEQGEVALSPRRLKWICKALHVTTDEMAGDPVVTFQVYTPKGTYAPIPPASECAGYTVRAGQAGYLQRLTATDIDTGIRIDVPSGYMGFLCGDSSLQLPDGIIPLGTLGSGHARPVIVKLINLRDAAFLIKPGDALAKLFFVPAPPAELHAKVTRQRAAED